MKDILVVEDGTPERERLLTLFNDAGYAVEGCARVGDAEAILQLRSFRLAILDIGLHDKSGAHLFTELRRQGKTTFIIIFTGNPSVHLKDRFISEGAADYIVKGSRAAQSDMLLARVRELIGEPSSELPDGIPLDEFLSRCVPPTTRALFLNNDNSLPVCSCGGSQYVVSFAQNPQLPPDIKGIVVCADCGSPMDPEIS